MCSLIKCIIEDEDNLEADVMVDMIEVEVEIMNKGFYAHFMGCLDIWWTNVIKSMDTPLDTKNPTDS